jgi:hypothetical protein
MRQAARERHDGIVGGSHLRGEHGLDLIHGIDTLDHRDPEAAALLVDLLTGAAILPALPVLMSWCSSPWMKTPSVRRLR